MPGPQIQFGKIQFGKYNLEKYSLENTSPTNNVTTGRLNMVTFLRWTLFQKAGMSQGRRQFIFW